MRMPWLVCALSCLCCEAAAESGSFEFLDLDVDARAAALSSAYSALADDATALHYNPAALSRVRRHQASFMHDAHFAGIKQDYVAIATRWGWAAEVNLLDSGSIGRTTLANPDGGVGSVSARQMALAAGWGGAVSERWSLGGAFKLLRQSLAGDSASAAAFDAGALYKAAFLERLALSAVLQNFGSGPEARGGGKERLPSTLRLGAVYEIPLGERRLALALEARRQQQTPAVLAGGLELPLAERLFLRLGASSLSGAGAGITAGAGWRGEDWSFDYALAPQGALGAAHRASIGVRWGPARAL